MECCWPVAQHVYWFASWIDHITRTCAAYPLVAYGTDWLAFAHLAIATAFWGRIAISFGVVGAIPLPIARRLTIGLERSQEMVLAA